MKVERLQRVFNESLRDAVLELTNKANRAADHHADVRATINELGEVIDALVDIIFEVKPPPELPVEPPKPEPPKPEPPKPEPEPEKPKPEKPQPVETDDDGDTTPES